MAWGDYDRDGDPDLLVAGMQPGGASVAWILRNDRTNFVNSGIGLMGCNNKPVSWVDFNNDGLLDCAVGEALYRQYENGDFILRYGILPECRRGAHAWGDFNGDGLPDLAICGKPDGSVTGRLFTRILRNDGETNLWGDITPVLTPVATNLPGIWNGNLAWCDFDADGRLELALCGILTDTEDSGITAVWGQGTDGTFADMGADLPPIVQGQVAWVDSDADGDADLFLGRGAELGIGNSTPLSLMMARSRLAAADGMSQANAPPTAPPRLRATSGSSSNEIHLMWDPASDDLTSPASLGYCVRVGLTPETCETVSPFHGWPPPGNALHVLSVPSWFATRHCNTNSPPGLRLRNLPAGRYYWSVRSVDGAGGMSPWSESQSFAITAAGLRTGDVNGDGAVDAADVVRCRNMIAGRVTPNLAVADMNADGRLDESDTDLIARLLLHQGSAEGYLPLARGTIGAAGGTLAARGVQFAIAPGTFGSDADLVLETSDTPSGMFTSPTYRLRGWPLDTVAGLTVSIPDRRSAPTNTAALFLGWPGYVHGYGDELGVCYDAYPVATASGGRLSLAVPSRVIRALGIAETAAAEPPSGEDRWGIYLGWDFSSWYYRTNAHFRVYYDDVVTDRLIGPVLSEFAGAYALYARLSFNMLRVPQPYYVWVYDFGNRERVGETGPSSIYLRYNAYDAPDFRVLDNPDRRVSTIYHEFFHAVQYAYGAPQYYSHTLWLDEATATWVESLVSTNPAETMENYNTHWPKFFTGLGNDFRTARQNYGYGAAALIDQVVRRCGSNMLARAYEQILADGDTTAIQALTRALPPGAWPSVHLATFTELLTGQSCFAKKCDLASTELEVISLTVSSADSSHKGWSLTLPGLGARIVRVYLDPRYTGLGPDDAMAFRLVRQDAASRLLLFEYSRNVAASTQVVQSAENPWSATMARALIPNIRAFRDRTLTPNIVALAVRSAETSPAVASPARLAMNIVQHLTDTNNLIGYTFSAPTSVYFSSLNDYTLVPFPQFVCGGTFGVTDTNLYGLVSNRLTHVSGSPWGYNAVALHVWEDRPVPAVLRPFVALVAPQTSVQDGAKTHQLEVSNLRYQVAQWPIDLRTGQNLASSTNQYASVPPEVPLEARGNQALFVQWQVVYDLTDTVAGQPPVHNENIARTLATLMITRR